MKSYLDLSGCSEETREKHKGLLRIPVTRGKHEMDIDLMMEELPEKHRSRLIAQAKRKNDRRVVIDKDLPIGLNVRDLPPGAVLHLEIEEDF